MKNRSSEPFTKKKYSGNGLRETLISAGIVLLNEGGQAGLTLRKCAAKAGVSHAAPAHHFNKIEGLLTAIAASGYQQLTDRMIEQSEKSSNSDKARLAAICTSYLEFSNNNVGLYDLMFSSEQISFADSELQKASTNAFNILAQTCAPLKKASANKEDRTLEIAIWSLLHGYSDISRKSAKNDKHPAYSVSFEEVLETLLN